MTTPPVSIASATNIIIGTKPSMHLLSTVASLALFTSTASATVVQHCVAFEGPMAGFTPLLEIHPHDLNTTVMVNHFEDIDERLTLDMSVDVRQPVLNSKFPVVESENGTVLFDEKAIVHRHRYKSIHKALAPGESTSLSIETTGVYCVHVYQDTDDFQVHGVDILASHVYGDTPMTRHLWFALASFVYVVLLFHTYIIPRLFPRMHSVHSTESLVTILWTALYGRAYIHVVVNFFPFVILHCAGERGLSDLFQMLTPQVLISELIAVLLISVFYRIKLGLFCYRTKVFTILDHRDSDDMIFIIALEWATILLWYMLIINLFHERRLDQALLLILLASWKAASASMDSPACNAEAGNNDEKFGTTPSKNRYELSFFCCLASCSMFHAFWGMLLVMDRNSIDFIYGFHENPWVCWLCMTSGPTPHQWLITLCFVANCLSRVITSLSQ